MATNFNKLLIALFFTAVASASVAHGITINGTQINVVQVQALGLLTCQIPGSNIPGNPITNATVALNCGNVSFNPTKTNLNGEILLAYSLVGGTLFDSSNCTATVTLGNAADCTVYLPKLTAATTLTLLNIVETLAGQAVQFALNILLSALAK